MTGTEPGTLTVGVARPGPIARSASRSAGVERLLALLAQADTKRCHLMVYPELARTTFFPRWHLDDQSEVDAFCERATPNEATQPLFDEAARRGMGFHPGYAGRGIEQYTLITERTGAVPPPQ